MLFRSTLYEDENVNYNYEKGAYSTISFAWDDASRTLKIGERQGEFPGMLQRRRFNVVLVTPENSRSYTQLCRGVAAEYDGTAQEIRL